MAKIIGRSCDMTGAVGADVAALAFAYDGKVYHLDLAPSAKATLDEALAPFLAKAHRVVTKGETAGAGKGSRAFNELNAKIREWAAIHMPTVGLSGRGWVQVKDAYLKAHPQTEVVEDAPADGGSETETPTETPAEVVEVAEGTTTRKSRR